MNLLACFPHKTPGEVFHKRIIAFLSSVEKVKSEKEKPRKRNAGFLFTDLLGVLPNPSMTI